MSRNPRRVWVQTTSAVIPRQSDVPAHRMRTSGCAEHQRLLQLLLLLLLLLALLGGPHQTSVCRREERLGGRRDVTGYSASDGQHRHIAQGHAGHAVVAAEQQKPVRLRRTSVRYRAAPSVVSIKQRRITNMSRLCKITIRPDTHARHKQRQRSSRARIADTDKDHGHGPRTRTTDREHGQGPQTTDDPLLNSNRTHMQHTQSYLPMATCPPPDARDALPNAPLGALLGGVDMPVKHSGAAAERPASRSGVALDAVASESSASFSSASLSPAAPAVALPVALPALVLADAVGNGAPVWRNALAVKLRNLQRNEHHIPPYTYREHNRKLFTARCPPTVEPASTTYPRYHSRR